MSGLVVCKISVERDKNERDTLVLFHCLLEKLKKREEQNESFFCHHISSRTESRVGESVQCMRCHTQDRG